MKAATYEAHELLKIYVICKFARRHLER